MEDQVTTHFVKRLAPVLITAVIFKMIYTFTKSQQVVFIGYAIVGLWLLCIIMSTIVIYIKGLARSFRENTSEIINKK